MSKEKFEEMKAALDKDGDGSVDKEEFMSAYGKMFPKMSQEEKDAVWAKMDKDGSGTLETKELAEYYGFDWESGTATEMSDEQILNALMMASAAAELEEEEGRKKKEAEAKKEEEKPKAAAPQRDSTITMIHLDKKEVDEKYKDSKDMLVCLQIGDLQISADRMAKGEDSFMQHLETKKTIYRVEDEKGEMPLHKLARIKVTDHNREAYSKSCVLLVEKMKEEAKALGKNSIASDVNHQDKAGKTPLFMAVEHKNIKMIDFLYSLKAEGPDTIIVNSVGWTVMHAAVHADDVETLKALTNHITPARTKLLLQTQDKTGREPLHIAAYKASEEVVAKLIALGASDKAKDSSGNTASKLADRAGRRKSREMIEDGCGGPVLEEPLSARRKSRASKETVETAAAAAAAAPAAAPAAK